MRNLDKIRQVSSTHTLDQGLLYAKLKIPVNATTETKNGVIEIIEIEYSVDEDTTSIGDLCVVWRYVESKMIGNARLSLSYFAQYYGYGSQLVASLVDSGFDSSNGPSWVELPTDVAISNVSNGYDCIAIQLDIAHGFNLNI